MKCSIWALAMLCVCRIGWAQAAKRQAAETVVIRTDKPANRFRPSEALGAGVDGHEKGDIAAIYRPRNIAAMRSAGFGPLSYRLRTELGTEAWHWNTAGVWSNPKQKSGYWTSADHADKPLKISNGYSLPRRGNTLDQANNRSYSRLDDDDPLTFWKSNPYLDSHFTREDDALHPQWIMLDFGAAVPIDAVRILWGTPWAVRFRVEYRTSGDPIYLGSDSEGAWQMFPQGEFRSRAPIDSTLRLCRKPILIRYLRVLLQESAKQGPPGSADVRDGVGYAIREISAGIIDVGGRLQDAVKHGKSAKSQTMAYASSTDSWHRAEDIDRDVEQPGFDTIFASGLTNGLPMLTPVALLYDTPDNAAAEIRYLKAKKVPLPQIELGEEPDGQYISPEDYGALYLQFADAIHAAAPELKLGGPGFQTDVAGWYAWPDASGNVSWLNRFLRYLKRRNRMKDFNFFSFEWYPFDDIWDPPAHQLAAHPALFAHIMQTLERDGLTHDIPWIITEYGYSSFTEQAEVELPGAILNAEVAAQFLTMGGGTAYLYGYEPNEVIQELAGRSNWGNLMLLQKDEEGGPPVPLPCYYGAKLLTQEWAMPGNGLHEIFPAACALRNKVNQPLITAFALHRPDGQWAVLLLNKDPKSAHSIRLQFRNSEKNTKKSAAGTFAVRRIAQYSPEQYRWKADGASGHPVRNLPPKIVTFPANYSLKNAPVSLPPYSITVVRGTLNYK